MKTIMKAALGVALFGAAAFVTAPAEARGHVSVGIGIGVPGPVYADPCYGPDPDPGYCGYPVYAEPVFYEGVWYDHPRYRVIGGRRAFFVHGGWHGGHAGHHGRHR